MAAAVRSNGREIAGAKCVANLLVENPPIGHYNNRVEDFFPVLAQADELVRKPRT